MLGGDTLAISPRHGQAPAVTAPVAAGSRGGETERWGNEEADHHNLTPDYLRSPSPEENAPRADGSGTDGRAETGTSGGGGGPGDGTPAISPHHRWNLPPAPAAKRPVTKSRSRGVEPWRNEGPDHRNLTPDYLRPPPRKRTPPGRRRWRDAEGAGLSSSRFGGGLGDVRRGAMATARISYPPPEPRPGPRESRPWSGAAGGGGEHHQELPHGLAAPSLAGRSAPTTIARR